MRRLRNVGANGLHSSRWVIRLLAGWLAAVPISAAAVEQIAVEPPHSLAAEPEDELGPDDHPESRWDPSYRGTG